MAATASDAVFKHGNPLMVDHTASGTAIPGTGAIVIGDQVLIAHRDIAIGEKGALAAGGGVYECIADAAIATGKKVWWNASTNKVTATQGANRLMGYITSGTSAAADGDAVWVQHATGLPTVDS